MPLLQSPLQVLYTRRSGNAYHRALQTSWRGWADSKAVHSMECVGGALALLEGSLSRGCCLQCSVLLALEGVLPNLELELSHKEPKQQTLGPVPGWYIYSWWHSASPANGNGSHDSAPVSWAHHILCPTMVPPNAN